MSAPHEPPPAKLVVGLLFRDFDIRSEVLQALNTRFGPLDYLSEPKIFEYTSYYEREMGPGLYRQVGSFLRLVPVETLSDIKAFTNDLERRFLLDDRRRINIDPGLLSEERFILATGKNFTHRIYLRDGIYADLTLIYQRGAYRTLPWTYPDYGASSTRQVLGVLRQKLIYQRTGRIPTKEARPRGDSY